MNDNEKCQNMCCPYNTVKLFVDPVPPSCATGADADECGDFTTTPTTSISVAELEKLRADKERVEWLERWSPRIYFNAAGNWAIERPGEEIATGVTLTEAIDKARK